MQRTIHNNVACYNLSAGKTLPEWLKMDKDERKKQRDFTHRIELLQDFTMPAMCTNIWQSNSGSYIFLTGGYPPQFKCFDVNELSVKFSRHVKDHIVQGMSLSDDYRQLVLLMEGRWVEFHGQGGVHCQLRSPVQGRCMDYNAQTCDLIIAGSSPEVHRLNLSLGEFTNPYVCDGTDVNVVKTLAAHNLDLMGCDDGTVRVFNHRTYDKCTAELALVGASRGVAATALALDPYNDYGFAVGTSEGMVHVYDLRMNRSVLTKDHCSSLPIKKLTYFESAPEQASQHPYVISADSSAIRVWSKNDGGNFTTLESPSPINDFHVVSAGHNMVPPYKKTMSGLVLMACEDTKGGVMFLPSLGIAPKWCAFLDTLTEELDHNDHVTVYQDYTFLSRPELAALGLDDAALSAAKDVVRPVMHGYFVEEKFLTTLRSLMNENTQADREAAAKRKKAKADPITPALPRRKVRKSKVLAADKDGKEGADDRFASRMEADKELFEMDPRGVSYAQRRDALHRSLFEDSAVVGSGGVAVLKEGADFHQSDAALVTREIEGKRRATQSLGHRARSAEERKQRHGDVVTDGKGNMSVSFGKDKKKKKTTTAGKGRELVDPMQDDEEASSKRTRESVLAEEGEGVVRRKFKKKS
eukprot:PhM_4_TR7058/c0_g1_i1/m.86593/K14788/NOL10, ENP2; ribosome biogenesis protein ENP2